MTEQARRDMRQELAHLEQRIAELAAPALLTGDLGDRAAACEGAALVGVAATQMIARARALREALARMAAGTYGTCARCHARIGAARLAALPETEWCVTCARALERDAVRPSRPRIDDQEDP